MNIIPHCDLLPYNTFGMSQYCDELITYTNEDDATDLAKRLRSLDASEPFMIIGGGSNLLLTRDFHGTVVTPEKRFEVEVEKDFDDPDGVILRCWAGTTFDDVVAWAVAHGYYGLENLSLVPGECGAAAVQNIGAYGVEAKDVIYRIDAANIYETGMSAFSPQYCEYGYRDSAFKHEWRYKYLLTYVYFRLKRTFKPNLDYGNIRNVLQQKGIDEATLTAQQLRDCIIEIRQAKLPDPKILGNAGSFFMNPVVDEATFQRLKAEHPDLRYFDVTPEPDGWEELDEEGNWVPAHSKPQYKIPAGWLIDQCGWKGKSLGPAGVYEKQALVLVNKGGAKGEDIVRLMKAIQEDVEQKYGLKLHPEVNIK